MESSLDIETVKKNLPKNLRSAVTDEFIDRLKVITDGNEEEIEFIKDNFVTYNHVLTTGKYQIKKYIEAITYVSYKLLGYTNQDAYIKVFPEKVEELRTKKGEDYDISSFVSAYHSGKLVNDLLSQALTPFWLLNLDKRQKALNTLVWLMSNARSEMVRFKSADSIMTHLAKPELNTATLNITTSDSSELDSLKDAITSLAKQQKELMNLGYTAKSIAEQNIVNVTVEPEEEE